MILTLRDTHTCGGSQPFCRSVPVVALSAMGYHPCRIVRYGYRSASMCSVLTQIQLTPPVTYDQAGLSRPAHADPLSPLSRLTGRRRVFPRFLTLATLSGSSHSAPDEARRQPKRACLIYLLGQCTDTHVLIGTFHRIFFILMKGYHRIVTIQLKVGVSFLYLPK